MKNQRYEKTGNERPDREFPPFVKSWRQFYRLLVGWLLFLLIIFYIFTRYFE